MSFLDNFDVIDDLEIAKILLLIIGVFTKQDRVHQVFLKPWRLLLG